MATENTQVNVDALVATGAHFAHVKSRRHPSMKKFILGNKNKVDLIDLSKSVELFEAAAKTIERYGAEGKTVLFVAGKREAIKPTRAIAESLSMPHVTGRWLGGTLTNFSEIKKRLARLEELKKMRESADFSKKYTKLERLMLSREENRLETRLGGLSGLTKLPDLIVVVDTKSEAIAIAEAKGRSVPVIGIMSSDCDTADATYPIVVNDASVKTIELVLSALAGAYKKGRDGTA